MYLRPMGFLWGSDADEAVGRKIAGRLAGGSGSFGLVEVIRRESARVQREIATYGALRSTGEGAIRECLEALSAPRDAVAGLALKKTHVMGVINITPDSFSDGGQTPRRDAAVERGKRFVSEGADIVDIGGESTRPGAEGVPLEEEHARVIDAVADLSATGIPVSIDTRKPAIMSAAVAAGARMINDVSALRFEATSATVAAALGVPVILMHARGDPKTMQDNPVYEDVVLDVYDELSARVAAAEQAGLPRSRLLVDPGIGFGKTFRHNVEILKNLAVYHGMGVALLIGASRKRFLGAITGVDNAAERDAASIGVAVAAAAQGVQLVRVHDVKGTVQAIRSWRATCQPECSGL
jgi:dihydropteroate synthase